MTQDKYVLDDVYGKGFFKDRDKMKWRADVLCPSILNALFPTPKTLVDIGCAVGDLVAGFRKRGVSAYGVEGSLAAFKFLVVDPGYVYHADMREPDVILGRSFSLALCFDVVEHVESVHSETFLKNLVGCSDRILMSAAHPGQEGVNHVNCRPASYWEGRMHHFGFEWDRGVSEMLKEEWSEYHNVFGIRAIRANLMYFIKR